MTVTKRRNRLKGDIVEALQCLKCALRNDFLVHETAPSSLVERDLVVEDSDIEDVDDESMGVAPQLSQAILLCGPRVCSF